MNQLAPLKKYITALVGALSKYSYIVFLLVFAGMAGFLVIRIGSLSRLEPTQLEIDTKLLEIKKQSKADEEAIEKLEALKDRDVKLETLFDNGRTNPFED